VTGGLLTALAGAVVFAKSRLVRDYQPPEAALPSG
jgi:hypothetical protein